MRGKESVVEEAKEGACRPVGRKCDGEEEKGMIMESKGEGKDTNHGKEWKK